MGYFATKESHLRVAVWLIWFLVMVAALGQSSTGMPTSSRHPRCWVLWCTMQRGQAPCFPG
jgi:hypothetical protein